MVLAAILLITTSTPPSLHVPPLASIFGIRVGRNGEDRLDRHLGGGGKVHVGGHSNSGQTWQIANPRSSVDVDGFSDTAHEGYLIEGLTWEIESGSRNAGHTRIPRSRAWMGQIVLGMKLTSALRLARRRLGPGNFKDGYYEWTQRGYSKPSFLQNDKPCSKWHAAMGATKGRVTSITLSCE